MNTADTTKYKNLLETERDILVTQLNKVAFQDDENPTDWVPKRQSQNISDGEAVEEFELAEEIQVFENNTATVKELESRLNDVLDALKKIESGEYGIDEVNGEPISPERLDANPAARTSVENAVTVEQEPLTENEID